MKATFKPIIQWSLFLSLMTVGFVSFLVMAGDEDPNESMSLTCFFLKKTIAMAVFAGVFFACKYCYSKRLFPDYINRIGTGED